MEKETSTSYRQTTLALGQKSTKSSARKSYTKDEKLRVVAYYKENDCNCYKTCKFFDINSKNLYRWLKDERKYRLVSGVGDELNSTACRVSRTGRTTTF